MSQYHNYWLFSSFLQGELGRFSVSYSVGAPVVHPELLNGDAEGDEVEQGSDPAVESRVVVTRLHVILKLADISVLLFERNIFDKGDASDIEENSHEGKLNDSPGRYHHSA